MATSCTMEYFSWVPGEDEKFKCRSCKICNGLGCVGQLPGMGGVSSSENFIENCLSWDLFYKKSSVDVQKKIKGIIVRPENIGIAPVTGAVQNIGFLRESDFYQPYFAAACQAGNFICVGDGAPDEKLQLGHKAVCSLNTKAYYFFKPYPDEILKKRIDLVRENAIAVGMDIDAFNIVTMRNQAHLEYKTREQVEAFREYSKLPIMLKGIFSQKDIELCKQVKPDICVVSNHGGRVDTQKGSTMDFLLKNAETLHSCCGQVWVDGGIRTKNNIQSALYLGADKVLIARGFISRLIKGGVKGMVEYSNSLLSN